jgi:hypothetical protein
MDLVVKKEDNPFPELMYSCTTDPQILAAARKFDELLISGEAKYCFS